MKMIDNLIYSDDLEMLYGMHNRVTKNLEIKEGVTNIQMAAFSYNAFLESVTFPSTLKHISAFAFRDCHKLHTLNFKSSNFTICKDTFWYCDNLKHIYFPKDTKIEDIDYFLYNSFKDIISIEKSISITELIDQNRTFKEINDIFKGNDFYEINK